MDIIRWEENGVSLTAQVLPEFEDGIPRVMDVDLATQLGMVQPRDIRKLIKRNLEEIEALGVCATVAQTSSELGGRPTEVYWLTEDQAIAVCQLSEGLSAVKVRVGLRKMYRAYREGKLQPLSNPTAIMLADFHTMTVSFVETQQSIIATQKVMASTQQATAEAFIESNRETMACLRDLRTQVIEGRKEVLQTISKKRRDIKIGDRATVIDITRRFYNSLCPCCAKFAIVEQDGRPNALFSIDHWNGPHNAKLTEVWPVCSSCNQRLDKEPGFKADHMSEFRTFQNRIVALNQQETLFRIN